MPSVASFEQVYAHAVRYLTVRSHTVGELLDKLTAKKYPAAVIQQVIRRLEELDFLNDERYAQLYIEAAKQHRDYGYYGIRARLLKKRIPSDIIEQAVQSGFTTEDELAVARRFVEKLTRRQSDRRKPEQVARSLGSRGFRSEIIAQALAGLKSGEG